MTAVKALPVTLEKEMMPIILLRRDGKRYMVTMFRRKASAVEVSCVDNAGYQYWRQVWAPWGKQKIGPIAREIITFAEAHVPKGAE